MAVYDILNWVALGLVILVLVLFTAYRKIVNKEIKERDTEIARLKRENMNLRKRRAC